ncbi:malate synthase [Burkholderia stagnalis]|uniref:Malate synthase n=1 Tax=Burkholderia stagnalis TaxID=1503054 RepID=A0A6L3MQA5_9BURK|nr:malate synthase [Burkholderia stagnalis]
MVLGLAGGAAGRPAGASTALIAVLLFRKCLRIWLRMVPSKT